MENGDMAIASLQRSNSDNYTCHVENIHGADAIIYQIIVQGEFGAINCRQKTNPRIYITVCVYQIWVNWNVHWIGPQTINKSVCLSLI